MPGAMDFRIADDSESTSREQAAQITIASFADIPKPILACARVLFGDEPDSGREVPSGPECLRISDTGNQSGGQCWTDARNLIEPSARFPGSVPSPNHTIELQDLSLQRLQLGAESGDTRACNLRQTCITYISDNAEELFNTIASDWRDDPEFGQMGADRIDH
jgi:hypothetical protein